MRRYTASHASVEEMEAIPSIYFRATSPPLSKASRAIPPLNIPPMRSSASAAANRRVDREKLQRSPVSPTRVESEGYSTKTYVHSYQPGYTPQPRPSASSSTSSSSRSHQPSSQSHAEPPHPSRRQNSGSGTTSHSGNSRAERERERERERTRASVPPSSIPHLREALNSLESQMANLMFERRKLESRLEQAVRQQAPVYRLPRELLGSIFEIAVHPQDEEDAVLLSTLMLVCRDWTELAFNTPTLWSRIIIDNSKSIPRARRKLARSMSVPLDIWIQFGPQLTDTPGSQTVTELVVHAMDILRPAMWRWRTFRLAVPSRSQAHAALAQCKEPAPLLEDLAIQIHHVLQEDSFAKPPPVLFQGELPRLRTCAITSFNFGWNVGLVSGLRVLKLGGYWNGFAPSVGTILNVLRACPTLEELALRNMSDVESGYCPDYDWKGTQTMILNSAYFPKESDMICLPRLKSASFYYAGIERMHAVFSQLLFPALERVEFSFLENLTPIIKHLKRQSFTSLPLRHLRIESCFFNELKLVRLLNRLPTLRTLELVDVEDISSDFLRVSFPYAKVHAIYAHMLTVVLKGLSAPAQGWICPKLETLNFDGCTTVDWDALRALVESRLPANAPRILNLPNASFARNNTTFVSSASSYAAQQRPLHHMPSSLGSSRVSRASSAASGSNGNVDQGLVPKRLRVIDLTRCPQISKEMIQWLRMYVSEVRCESVKTYWGEFGFSS